MQATNSVDPPQGFQYRRPIFKRQNPIRRAYPRPPSDLLPLEKLWDSAVDVDRFLARQVGATLPAEQRAAASAAIAGWRKGFALSRRSYRGREGTPAEGNPWEDPSRPWDNHPAKAARTLAAVFSDLLAMDAALAAATFGGAG